MFFLSHSNVNIKTEHPIIQPTYVNMSELATMAALKITNSINQHYQQQYQEQLTPQSHAPPSQFSAPSPCSDTSSINTQNLHTTNSSNTATNPDNSPDVSSANTDTLSQQTLSPTTATHTPQYASTNNSRSSRQASVEATAHFSNDNDDYLSDYNQTISSTNSVTASINSNNSTNTQQQHQHQLINNDDEVDDYKSTGSVLEKLTLFEKLEQRQAAMVNALNAASLVKPFSATSVGIESPVTIKKTEELSKSIRSIDKDQGKFATKRKIYYSSNKCRQMHEISFIHFEHNLLLYFLCSK